MLKTAGKSIAVVLSLGITATAWAAAALPGSDPQVRALEENRSQAEQQAQVTAPEEAGKVQGEQKFMLTSFDFTGHSCCRHIECRYRSRQHRPDRDAGR